MIISPQQPFNKTKNNKTAKTIKQPNVWKKICFNNKAMRLFFVNDNKAFRSNTPVFSMESTQWKVLSFRGGANHWRMFLETKLWQVNIYTVENFPWLTRSMWQQKYTDNRIDSESVMIKSRENRHLVICTYVRNASRWCQICHLNFFQNSFLRYLIYLFTCAIKDQEHT